MGSSHSHSVTTTKLAIAGISLNARIDQPTIGTPHSSTNCLGRPKRSPRPAATTTAAQISLKLGS